MSNNLEETCSCTTATKLSRIIISLPADTQESVHLSIKGVSHRMPYSRLPRGRKARSRLLANASSLTLHDVPIWTLKSGDVLTKIEACTALQSLPLAFPLSVQIVMEVPLPSRREKDTKERTNFVVDLCHSRHALTDIDIPIRIVSVTVENSICHIIFVTLVGSLLLYVVSLNSRSLISKTVLGYNVTACSVLQTTLYFLSSGRLYTVELDSICSMATAQSNVLQPQQQTNMHLVPHGAKVLTHISTDGTEMHALSPSGTIYSGTSNGLVRLLSFDSANIVSFVAVPGKRVAYIVLRSTMIAYLYTIQGDVLATYSAVLQALQTVDKQGALLLLREMLILVYGDIAYSILLPSTVDSVSMDSFSLRLLSSGVVGNTLTIIYSSGSKCFWLVAKFPIFPGSQSKRTSLQTFVSMESITVKEIIPATQVSSNSSFFSIIAAHNLPSCCIYFVEFRGPPLCMQGTGSGYCIFGERCLEPCLCSFCRCPRTHSTAPPVLLDSSAICLGWYIDALTEAGRLLNYDLAAQIVSVGMSNDKIKAELISLYATNSLASFLHPFMFNLACLELLVRTGCSFLALHIAIFVIQHYGASTPWLTALTCQETSISRRHLRDLASIFSLHLNFFGIPELGIPAQCKAETGDVLNCETAEN